MNAKVGINIKKDDFTTIITVLLRIKRIHLLNRNQMFTYR